MLIDAAHGGRIEGITRLLDQGAHIDAPDGVRVIRW